MRALRRAVKKIKLSADADQSRPARHSAKVRYDSLNGCGEMEWSFFTRATLASAGISCRRVSVCLSVRPSLTSRCSTETAKRRIMMQTRLWTNTQPDGRPAEYRWRPLFNAAKIG